MNSIGFTTQSVTKSWKILQNENLTASSPYRALSRPLGLGCAHRQTPSPGRARHPLPGPGRARRGVRPRPPPGNSLARWRGQVAPADGARLHSTQELSHARHLAWPRRPSGAPCTCVGTLTLKLAALQLVASCATSRASGHNAVEERRDEMRKEERRKERDKVLPRWAKI
jgi:hypothetical protein